VGSKLVAMIAAAEKEAAASAAALQKLIDQAKVVVNARHDELARLREALTLLDDKPKKAADKRGWVVNRDRGSGVLNPSFTERRKPKRGRR
jgi:hypothetical protein